MGMLGHSRVEIVLNHHHYRGSLAAFCRILVDVARVHLIMRAQAVHVDAAIVGQFLGKFRGQFGVKFGRKITQGVAQGEFFLLGR